MMKSHLLVPNYTAATATPACRASTTTGSPFYEPPPRRKARPSQMYRAGLTTKPFRSAGTRITGLVGSRMINLGFAQPVVDGSQHGGREQPNKHQEQAAQQDILQNDEGDRVKEADHTREDRANPRERLEGCRA